MTVAFLVSSVYAICITKGLSLNDRIMQFSQGAANKNVMLMIWIFVLAGAFAQSAKEASAEIGKHMVECTLEWLREAIQ